MSKVTLTDLANLQNDTTATTAINSNSAAITTAIENTLSRDGTSPNQMSANLDMDSNQIINLPAPGTQESPVRLADMTAIMDSFTPTASDTGRDKLSANRTYYVRTDGSNNNSGLLNTPGGAFATIQKAIDTVANIDIGLFTVAISVADGTYTENLNLYDTLGIFPNGLSITGNTTTPSNCIIDGSHFINSVGWNFKGFKFQNTAGGTILNCDIGSILGLRSNVVFGAATGGAHVYCHNGGICYIATNYTINGGGSNHWLCESGGLIRCRGVTITTSGTPAFTDAFAGQNAGGHYQIDSLTFAGTGTTGKRFRGDGGGSYYTGTSGNLTYLPGNAAGTVADGTTYDYIAGINVTALSTTATKGFLYAPSCAGTPTGTPDTLTGYAPIVINTTNNKLYFFSGGAWRDAGP